ncbi:hypothetical protein ACE6H2_026145 [Prunus campanulata]
MAFLVTEEKDGVNEGDRGREPYDFDFTKPPKALIIGKEKLLSVCLYNMAECCWLCQRPRRGFSHLSGPPFSPQLNNLGKGGGGDKKKEKNETSKILFP